MVKVYRVTFTAEGKGSFPMDMLRYDNCHPYKLEDYEHMQGREVRSVKLERICPTSKTNLDRLIRSHEVPTVGRWASFGWTIDYVSVEEIKPW